MPIDQSYNYRKINDKLTTSGVVNEAILKTLSDSGYDLVINLLPPDNQHAILSEQQIVTAQGIEYINIPVDFDAPQVQELETFFEVMSQVGEKKIHIHCAANWRVSAFYGAYAVSNGIWTIEQANDLIRSLWSLPDYSEWVALMAPYGIEG